MSYFTPLIWVVGVLALLQLSAPAKGPAEEPPVEPVEVAPAPRAVADKPVIPRRHALILCGHPGDDAHAKSFAEPVGKLREGSPRPSAFQRNGSTSCSAPRNPRTCPV